MFEKLDPRTKIIMLLLSILFLSLGLEIKYEIIITLIYILPFFLTGKYRGGITFLTIYSLQLVMAIYLLPHVDNPLILYSLTFIASGLRRMMPSIIAGAYALSTTTIGEWVATLKKWKFPNSIVITIAVIARFFPTIREDYRQIRNAMAFRGIGRGFISLIKSPLQSLEFIIIPLLMNASQVAQDLTISALTKGLALKGKHTSIVSLDFTFFDFLYLILIIAILGLYLGGVGL